MRFDWPADSDFQPTQAAPVDDRDRPLVPDGRHTATIVWAGEQARDWAKCDDNPTGAVLTVKLDFGQQWRPQWESIRGHWRGAIEAVCRAARVEAPTSGEDWDVKQLLGQVVAIDTVLAVSKAGREYVRVDKWHAGAAPLPVEIRKAPARTPARKAAAEFKAANGDDDIPF